MNPQMPHDQDFDRLLAMADQPVSAERAQRVRRAIMQAAAKPRGFFFLMRFEPALLAATAVLGLALGMTLPDYNDDDSSTAAIIEFHPQSFLTGDIG